MSTATAGICLRQSSGADTVGQKFSTLRPATSRCQIPNLLLSSSSISGVRVFDTFSATTAALPRLLLHPGHAGFRQLERCRLRQHLLWLLLLLRLLLLRLRLLLPLLVLVATQWRNKFHRKSKKQRRTPWHRRTPMLPLPPLPLPPLPSLPSYQH